MATYRIKIFSNRKGEILKKVDTPSPTGPLPKLPAAPKPPSLIAMLNLLLRLSGLAISLLNLMQRTQGNLMRALALATRGAELELKKKLGTMKNLLSSRAIQSKTNNNSHGIYRKITQSIVPKSMKRH